MTGAMRSAGVSETRCNDCGSDFAFRHDQFPVQLERLQGTPSGRWELIPIKAVICGDCYEWHEIAHHGKKAA